MTDSETEEVVIMNPYPTPPPSDQEELEEEEAATHHQPEEDNQDSVNSKKVRTTPPQKHSKPMFTTTKSKKPKLNNAKESHPLMNKSAHFLRDRNIDNQSIKELLGKSSVSIQAHGTTITILSTYQVQKRGDIIANLEKLLKQPTIDVSKLHASLAFLSILIPVTVVSHLETFSPKVIKSFASASLIRWEFVAVQGKQQTKLVGLMPKGEIYYISNKAQHCPKLTDQWITTLLKPAKFYLMTESEEEWSINKCTTALTYNRLPFTTDNTLKQEEMIDLQEKIITLFLYYVKTELLTKGKHKELCATRLKGLPPNLIDHSTTDSKPQYQYPEFWYFKKAQLKDWCEQKPTNWNETQTS